MKDFKLMTGQEILAELTEMKDKCQSEKRKPTDAERNLAAAMLDRLDYIEARSLVSDYEPTRPGVEAHGGFSRIQCTARRTLKPYELRQPGDKKDYRSMFGDRPNNYHEWTDQETNYFQAVFSGQMHPGLKRGMTEGVASDGGLLVPTEYSRDIFDIALESEIVRPRAYVKPMNSLDIHIPAFEVGDHSSGELYGGFQAYYKAEAASLTKTKPKIRGIDLKAKKLTGLIRMSNELIADSGSADRIMQICGQGLAWQQATNHLKPIETMSNLTLM